MGELHEAIAECQGERSPNAHTCAKLASYLTILDHMEKPKEQEIVPQYSYSDGTTTSVVHIGSHTEFAEAVDGMEAQDLWPIVDELMTALQVVNPRLYKSVMQKIG